MRKLVKENWKKIMDNVKGVLVTVIGAVIAGILLYYFIDWRSQNDSQLPEPPPNNDDTLVIKEPPDTLIPFQPIDNESVLSQNEIELVIDSANTNNVGIYYKVKLVIPWKMLGCKIFVDNNDANIIERNGIHIVIKIKGRQKSYKIKIENDKYKFGKEILIDKDIELTFSPEDIIT